MNWKKEKLLGDLVRGIVIDRDFYFFGFFFKMEKTYNFLIKL